MNARYAFRVRLKPGTAAEYIRLHSPVPAAVIAQLRRAGISDYSIYVDGEDVFGVLRYDDLATMRAALSDDVDPIWTQEVSDLMLDRDVDPNTGILVGMKQVFRFDPQSDPET